MPNTFTSGNAAAAVVKLVAAEAVAPLMGNLVMGNLVNRDYEPVIAQAGDVVNVPIPPVFVANNVLESGSVTPQNPNLGNAQIVLNTHAEATFNIPDVTKALVVPDLIQTLMKPALIAAATKIETDLLNLYSNFTANTAVGGASALDEARVDNGERALFDALVPAAERKFLVLSSTAYSAARQIPRFSDYQSVGDPSVSLAAIASGEVGKLKNFLVFRSQYVPKPAGTTYNLAFARDAIGLVIRRLPLPLPGTGAIGEYAELGNFGARIIMSYQPNTLSQQFTVDVFYGCAVLRNNFAVQVQTN